MANLEESICNFEELPFERFDGTIHELVEQKDKYHKGKMLDLWATGYMVIKDRELSCTYFSTLNGANLIETSRDSGTTRGFAQGPNRLK